MFKNLSIISLLCFSCEVWNSTEWIMPPEPDARARSRIKHSFHLLLVCAHSLLLTLSPSWGMFPGVPACHLGMEVLKGTGRSPDPLFSRLPTLLFRILSRMAKHVPGLDELLCDASPSKKTPSSWLSNSISSSVSRILFEKMVLKHLKPLSSFSRSKGISPNTFATPTTKSH